MSKESKDNIIEIEREEEGFLPYYSEAYYERISYWNVNMLGGGLLPVVLIAVSAIKATDNPLFGLLFAIVPIQIILCVLEKPLTRKSRLYGYHFTENELIKEVRGKKTTYSYRDIASAIEQKKVCICEDEFRVPLPKRGYIAFPYEIGNTKHQRQVIKCYKRLSELVHCKMPEMRKKDLELLDRAYFYNRSFKRCMTTLIILQISIFVFNCVVHSGNAFYFVNAIFFIVQMIAMFRMLKSTVLGNQNKRRAIAELQNELTDFDVHFRTATEAVFICGSVIALNFITYFINWVI